MGVFRSVCGGGQCQILRKISATKYYILSLRCKLSSQIGERSTHLEGQLGRRPSDNEGGLRLSPVANLVTIRTSQPYLSSYLSIISALAETSDRTSFHVNH